MARSSGKSAMDNKPTETTDVSVDTTEQTTDSAGSAPDHGKALNIPLGGGSEAVLLVKDNPDDTNPLDGVPDAAPTHAPVKDPFADLPMVTIAGLDGVEEI